MTVSIGTIEGRITLRDQFTGALTRASAQLEKHGKKMERTGRRMSEVGGTLTRSVTLPLVAVGGLAVKSFSDFDDAMNQSLAIMGDVSDALRDDMAKAAREVAKETVFSAKQAGESYFFLASAGLDAAQSIQAMPQVAAFAQAGMFDMARATDLLTDAQSALGLTVDDAAENVRNMARVSDVLVKANTLANASVEQFSTALTSKAGSALKAFNIDVEEGVAVLAAFADQGVKAELAGNSLDRILRLLPSAAIKNADAYRELGVQVFDASGNMRNLADVIADLEGALNGLSDQQKQATLEALGFEARIQGMIKPLLGTSDAIRGYEKDLRDAAGTTQEVADKQLESFKNQMGLVKDRIVDVLVTIGQGLAPVIKRFVDSTLDPLISKLDGVARGFAALPVGVRAVIVGMGALAAAAGPALVIAGALVTAWGAFASALPAIIAALARSVAVFTGPAGWIAVGVATLATWRPVREFLIELGRSAFGAVAEWVRRTIEVAREWWASTAQGRQFLFALHEVIRRDVIGAISALVGWVSDFVQNQVRAHRLTFELARAFLEWSGALDFARAQVALIAAGIKAFVQIAADAFRRLLDMAGGFEGLAAFISIVNPPLGVALGKMEEWVKKARASVEWNDRLSDGYEGVSESAEELTEWQRKMDEASADVLAAVEKETKAQREQEEQLERVSAATKEALKSMADAAAENKALFAALSESSDQYDILNTLLEAGIPLTEALSGAYDDQAAALIKVQKELGSLNRLREAEIEHARTMFDLQMKLNAARLEAAARAESGTVPGQIAPPDLEAAVVDPMEAARDAIKEGNKHFGDIEKKARETAEAWERIGNIMVNAVGEHNDGLAKTINSVIQLVAMWQQIKQLQEQGASALEQAAAGMAFGAALGSFANSVGIGQGDRGTSQFGGARSGDFSDLGATIGGLFGPWGAAIGLAVGLAIKKGADEARFEILASVEESTISWKALEGGLVEAGNKIGRAFRDAVDRALDLIDATMISGPNIDVKIRNDLIKVWVGGFTASFKDVEDAISFAVTALLRSAELSGISPEVRATLENTVAQTWEELEKELAVALRSRDIKLGEARASLRRAVEDFMELFVDEMKQGIIEATGASGGLIGLVDMFTSNYNRLLGIQEDVGEAARRQAEAHNAELKMAVARLQVMKAEMQAEIARMEISEQVLKMLDAEARAMLASINIMGPFGQMMLAGAQATLAQAQAQAALIETQLAAIAAIDEALAALEGLEVDVDAAAAAARRAARGGGGQGDMERLRETLEQMRFDRLLEDMTELEAGLARLDREYERQLELAHGNADLVAQLTEEYRLQEEQLRRNIQLSAVDSFRDFMGIGDDPFSELAAGFDEARTAVEEAGFGAGRTALMVARLTAEYERQLGQLSRQEFLSLGDDLLGFVETYFGEVEGFEDFRMRLEQMRFELELLNARQRFEILKAEGALSAAVLAQMQSVFDFIDANPIDWEQFVMPSAPRVQTAAREINNALEEMVRRLESAKQGIRAFLQDLQTGAFGGRSNREAFNAAFNQFQELASQPQNIQSIEQFPEVARRLLELARERFGSTAPFQEILAMVEGTGIDFLGVDQVREDNVVFDQRFFDAQRSQLEVDRRGHERVAQTARDGFLMLSEADSRHHDELVTELRGLRESQNQLNSRLTAIEARRRTTKVAS